MDKNIDFSGFPPYDNFNYESPMNDIYKDQIFNPMTQYEQAYMYYKCMCMQMDYKIKCKEYEQMCSKNSNKTRE